MMSDWQDIVDKTTKEIATYLLLEGLVDEIIKDTIIDDDILWISTNGEYIRKEDIYG